MDSNEKHFRSDHSGEATTLTIGSLFAFAIMGAFPVVAAAWIIRKIMIKSKHPATQHKQSRQVHQTGKGHGNNLDDDHETPIGSFRYCNTHSEELQPPVGITKADPNMNSVVKSNLSSVTLELPTPIEEPCTSTLRVRGDDDDLLTDGDDTITARLHENCVRLHPNHLKSPILPTTTIRVSTMPLDAAQTKARALEYRRACRPQRVYLDEIVPSDVELGLSKSRRKSKCTVTTTNVEDDDDELSYPSRRDPGIIHRYFGISFHHQTSTTNHPEPDTDPSHSSGCPNQASISSRSLSSSGFSDEDHDRDDDFDDGYYDATLYQDFRPLGELVDL